MDAPVRSTVFTSDVEEAAGYIRCGEVVAFPTETVFGLGADATNASAVERIFQAKNRPADNPLIVHAADMDGVRAISDRLPCVAELILAEFSPGPVTVILPRSRTIPPVVTAGLSTVGVRIPDHAVACALIRAAGVPVAAPSANLSGRPSPTTWQAVREDMDGRIACILMGTSTRVGLESTVVDCSVAPPVVLREGGTPFEALQRVCPDIRPISAVSGSLNRSPGTRYPHYAPRAHVIPIEDPLDAEASLHCAYIGLDSHPAADRLGLCVTVSDVEAYARELFEFFRTCDRAGVQTIYCQRVPDVGIGRALSDRIVRAAASGRQ